MKIQPISLSILLFCGLAVCQDYTYAASDTYSWYEDADGYAEAFEIAKTEKRPLIVYFYTDWCPYCTNFSDDYLDDYDVDNYVANYLRVMINPEESVEERRIADQYKISGYPTFFILGPNQERSSEMQPYRKSGNHLSIDSFIGKMKTFIDKHEK